MGRSRNRWRARRSAPFRAWGWVLAGTAAVLLYQHLWTAAGIVGALWVVYLALLRLTRCRVETTKHRPCGQRVRGWLGTCEYHVGYKRGLPRLVRGDGFVGLPTFMWPRDDFSGAWEPQPAATVGLQAKQPRQSGRSGRPGGPGGAERDPAMMWLTVIGVVVALLALIRDFAIG